MGDERPARDYRFARAPRWVVGHVIVLIAVVVMVNLGLWQLRRLDERRDANARVAERSRAAAVDVDQLAGEPIERVEFRRVTATGTFDADHEVLVGYRTSRGLPGYHVLTPLVLDNGSAVLVNRGFVPLSIAEDWPVADAAPPSGEVEVKGVLRRSFDARRQSIDPPSSERRRAPTIDDVDVEVIDQFVPGDLLPMHIELQSPRPAGFPDPLPDVDLSNGPHLSYAIQWFLFSTVAAVGWFVLLRRRAVTVTAQAGHSPPPR